MSKVTVVSRPNRITIASKGVQGAPGPQGLQGEQGIQGPQGDTGDVTPEAIAARDAAQEAASDAADSANLAEQARLLGATIGFATKADMDASLAHDAGTLALVTSDATAANNGTYRKTGASGAGSWVQSADRVTGLEGRVGEVEQAAEKLDGQLESVIDDDVIVVIDDSGKITLRQSRDGGLHLPGISGAIQDVINASANKYIAPARLVDFEDEAGELVSSILGDGDLATPKFTSGIGKMLDTSVAFPMLDKRRFLSPEAAEWVDELHRINGKAATVPDCLLPQAYTVRDSFIDDLVLPPQTEYHPIDTPYGPNDKVVHPYVIEFRTPFRGFRYLMCITPYRSETMENPVIYGSNDLRDWEMLDGFRQPLAEPPMHGDTWIADNGLCYDPQDGSLVCYWLASNRVTERASIMARKTWDGFTWSEPFAVLANSDRLVDELHSPSMLFDPVRGVWMLWVFATGEARLREAPSISGPWSEPVRTVGMVCWHGEVKYVGNKFVSLRVSIAGAETPLNYWLGISDDGINWTEGPGLFPELQPSIYKSSFVPVLQGGQIALDVVWTTNLHPTTDLIRRLFVARTNFVEMN